MQPRLYQVTPLNLVLSVNDALHLHGCEEGCKPAAVRGTNACLITWILLSDRDYNYSCLFGTKKQG